MDRTAGPEPLVSLPDGDGSVRVVVFTHAPPDQAWSALTDPARVEQWFGSISGEPVAGAQLRLDFEDGDFFDLEVTEVARPTISWSWRFMGCGPRDQIEFTVDPEPGGSRITVTDSEPQRTRAEALALGEGWRDFTGRLQRYLQTGTRTRYDWRSDVNVWIDLPVDPDAARRLVIGAGGEWLPLPPRAANLIAAGELVLDDGGRPATFSIEKLEGAGPRAVQFELRPEAIAGRMQTRVEILSRGDASALAIEQRGFRNLAAPDAVQRSIRERFAAAWLAAAWRAAALVDRVPA